MKAALVHLDDLTCYKSLLDLMQPNTCLIDYFDVVVLGRLDGMTFLRHLLPLEIRVQMSWAYRLLLILALKHSGMRA